ncbi:MAG: hypothetical protein LKE39_02195 [Sphaerochaeta sp.]|jgi:regulation of enolase protein 1 (concanavalin A-like superfamily)|nr:hypothetical protein [Sphaerochaeta sp.]MCH3919298.1 hypothetical protein [Sphaerochaeta sp.]MCI2097498.1 hypothetical protein [Sphaerochaeta sp.]MCI2104633.1 hypothetical protein [Sphaerochaeta sp.]
MAKLTMRSLKWLGKPETWHKDYRSLSLTVDPGTTYPGRNASILAVSDQNLAATVLLSIAPSGGECGMLVFQTDQSQIAAGAHQNGFLIHSMVMGYLTETHVSCPMNGRKDIWMRLERNEDQFKISYSFSGETFIPLVTSRLPGAESSFSFGFYFANATKVPFSAECGEFHVVPLS